MIYSGKGRPKKNYYVPKKERPMYTEIDTSEWKVSAITQKAVDAVKKAVLRRGGERESLIRLIVEEQDMHLFTPNVENRLLALFRGMFDGVVLIEIHSPEAETNRKRNALLKKAEKEHRKKMKEHESKID